MTGPGRDAVQAALCKLRASRPFQGSERISRFLTFVVNHALCSNPGPLKEHLIAQKVYDRGDSFDPRTDTIVRVEARRLRAKLKEYYAGEGNSDPLIIELADRGYAPSFRTRLQPEPAARSLTKRTVLLLAGAPVLAAGIAIWGLTLHRTAEMQSIVVLPFLNLSGNP